MSIIFDYPACPAETGPSPACDNPVMSDDAIRCRPATAADAPAIARLHAKSWRRAYRGMMGDAYLDGDIDGERSRFWSGFFAAPPPKACVIIAVAGRRLAGFASVYGDHDSDWGTRIENLHVDLDFGRRGVGATLMAEAARWCAREGFGGPVHLGVLQPNTPAIRFYERLGGRRVLELVWTSPDGNRVPEYRMAWESPTVLLANASRRMTKPHDETPTDSPARP